MYPSSVNRGYFSYWMQGRAATLLKNVSILCQSRLFLLHNCKVWVAGVAAHGIHPLSIEAISPTHRTGNRGSNWNEYPSSVNRGYFSYFGSMCCPRTWSESIHPLSIEAISPTWERLCTIIRAYRVSILCQSRLFLLLGVDDSDGEYFNRYPSSVNRGYFSYPLYSPRASRVAWGIHPLSIEAISPTHMSTLVLLGVIGIHPLSIEAISPTLVNLKSTLSFATSIHPLSIEAISPTRGQVPRPNGGRSWYPSSVNRGYFSYQSGWMSFGLSLLVSILCQSRLFLLQVGMQSLTP